MTTRTLSRSLRGLTVRLKLRVLGVEHFIKVPNTTVPSVKGMTQVMKVDLVHNLTAIINEYFISIDMLENVFSGTRTFSSYVPNLSPSPRTSSKGSRPDNGQPKRSGSWRRSNDSLQRDHSLLPQLVATLLEFVPALDVVRRVIDDCICRTSPADEKTMRWFQSQKKLADTRFHSTVDFLKREASELDSLNNLPQSFIDTNQIFTIIHDLAASQRAVITGRRQTYDCPRTGHSKPKIASFPSPPATQHQPVVRRALTSLPPGRRMIIDS